MYDETKENKINVFVTETHSFTRQRTYHKLPLKSNDPSYKLVMKEKHVEWKSSMNLFMSVFLPHGYPDSVSKDYLQYQIWDSIQAFASSITGSISTHAILKGVGVGNESASPLAATTTWLIKDGASMLGRIIFAWLQGTKLDSDCKKWRLFADVINDVAMFLDLVSAYFLNHFMLIICASGIFKSLVGVAGGATRAALTQHQARKNNMADVSAKDGSQETLVNLLALICSLVIMPIVTENFTLTWLLYIVMTTIHIVANYCAVKSVCMETFNKERFRIYVDHYLNTNMENCLSVSEVNKKESVFLSPWRDSIKINLGTSFNDIIRGKSNKDIDSLISLYEKSDYILSLTQKITGKVEINVVFNKNATSLTEVEAMYQACFLQHTLQHRTKNMSVEKLNERSLELSSRNFTFRTFALFKEQTEARGFKISTVLFDTGMWRAKW